MQKINSCTVILVISFLLLFSQPIEAKALDINTLVNQAKEYEGKEVTIQAEVIGEPLERGEYTWINVSDTTNAIGLWMSASVADQLSHFGAYQVKGDTIKFTGQFSSACSTHGGDADIHVTNLEIVKEGQVVMENLDVKKIAFAVVFAGLASIALFGCYPYIRKEREES